MNNLTQSYAAYFKEVVRKTYDPATQRQRPVDNGNPWQEPHAAIRHAFSKTWDQSPKWEDVNFDAVTADIELWLKNSGVLSMQEASFGYKGWTAMVFNADFKGQPQEIIRIGSEGGKMPHLNIDWNPFQLQPVVNSIFLHRQNGKTTKLALMRSFKPPMIPEKEPIGFDKFMNEHILTGTPWVITDHKDLNVLPDGTPIYSGTVDCINFRNPEAKRLHKANQRKPEYQQIIMAVIHANYERANVPDSMRCVVKTENGFMTKQGFLFRQEPVRSIHRIRPKLQPVKNRYDAVPSAQLKT